MSQFKKMSYHLFLLQPNFCSLQMGKVPIHNFEIYTIILLLQNKNLLFQRTKLIVKQRNHQGKGYRDCYDLKCEPIMRYMSHLRYNLWIIMLIYFWVMLSPMDRVPKFAGQAQRWGCHLKHVDRSVAPLLVCSLPFDLICLVRPERDFSPLRHRSQENLEL